MLTELVLEKYRVQSTGADGGHSYIVTEIKRNNIKRKLIVLFAQKCDERNLKENSKIKVKGELEDDGEKYDLIMRNTTIEI
jgi:hypothetical protein